LYIWRKLNGPHEYPSITGSFSDCGVVLSTSTDQSSSSSTRDYFSNRTDLLPILIVPLPAHNGFHIPDIYRFNQSCFYAQKYKSNPNLLQQKRLNEFAALFLYPMYFPPPLIQWGMLSLLSLPEPHPGTNYLLWSIKLTHTTHCHFTFAPTIVTSATSILHSPNKIISLSPTIGFLAPHYPSYPTLQPISASIEKLISSSTTQMDSLLHFTPFGHPLFLDLPAPLPPNQAELPSPVAVSLPTVPLEISPPATIMHALLCP